MKPLLMALALLGASVVQAETLRQSPQLALRVYQDGKQLAMQAEDNGVVRVTLAKAAFDLNYPQGLLAVCAWTDDSVYGKAKVGTDTMQDFTSCMLVYKFIAMPADASYLFLSKDSAFSLTAEHGAKTLSEKRATYRVTHLEQEGKGKPAIPLANVKGELYLATWMDKNKNQVIDADELERMVLEFK